MIKVIASRELTEYFHWIDLLVGTASRIFLGFLLEPRSWTNIGGYQLLCVTPRKQRHDSTDSIRY